MPAVSHQVDRAPRWSPVMWTAIVTTIILLGGRALQRRGEVRVAASP
jgi:hypothetical protein